ncbi:MAG: FGGY family carbohydrate kinase [Ferruginibacter sp.]
MSKTNVIAIFDIGKTNKKLFLFNEQYKIVFEQSFKFDETIDEDGFACEDIAVLTDWVKNSLSSIINLKNEKVVAVNFSTYGASFVHTDKEGKPVAPLYNYLKPFPEKLKQQFYKKYGGEKEFSKTTASPVLGNLNSGLQLYRLKNEQPELFDKIRYSLHLPQYFNSIITGRSYADITSIGCHTGLWNFQKNTYHEWLQREGIIGKLPGIFPSDQAMKTHWKKQPLLIGVGLHDSSAALIPYLSGFNEPFILLSTGTWCISLNPFNQTALTVDELANDCLCYMEYFGKPVKASRLFAGFEHEEQVKRLAAHFNTDAEYYTTIDFDPELVTAMTVSKEAVAVSKTAMIPQSTFSKKNLADFPDYASAYHQLMQDIMIQQVASTNLVLKDTEVKRIFVDGGFSRNPVYMNLLSASFPHIEIYAATVAQASATGAALAIHSYWNKSPKPVDLIELKFYSIHKEE